MNMTTLKSCTVLAIALAAAAWATPVDDIFAAIRANDLAKLDALTKDKPAVNTPDDRGITPLMISAVTGSPASMRLLIERGANVNPHVGGDRPPLVSAPLRAVGNDVRVPEAGNDVREPPEHRIHVRRRKQFDHRGAGLAEQDGGKAGTVRRRDGRGRGAGGEAAWHRREARSRRG